MKRIFLTLFICLSMAVNAENLGIISLSSPEEIHNLIIDDNITVNFYNDNYAIVTYSTSLQRNHILLTDNAWQKDHTYYIVYLGNDRDSYVETISAKAKILYENENFLIVEQDETRYGQLMPAKNDGIVCLSSKEVRLPEKGRLNMNLGSEPEQYIVDYLNEVNGENITATVQHLQDYGSRDTRTNGAVQAENWIKEQFEALGLPVETQNVPMGWGGSSAADNVIAVKEGTLYPDEYVVIGCHFDSYVFSGGQAPGADDNASGVGGVIEIARILADHDFARTMVFCTFAAEEYGLYGSKAYAEKCAQQGMDILAYLNIDMSGYLTPGETPHTSIIHPATASELYDYYRNVCSIYLPEFGTESGSLTGGDSDHTSFNNNGYMGIYPFEDSHDYSPYIHSDNDIVGVSFMNEEQAVMFTQAILANLVTIADQVPWTKDLVATPNDASVDLSWSDIPEIQQFNIYRNDELIATVTEPAHHDEGLQNFIQYQYYVTSVAADGKESKPSNIVHATPCSPISLPVNLDFENGDYYWDLTGSWGVTSMQAYSGNYGFSDSPNGSYENNVNSTATLNTLDLSSTGYDNLYLSFYHRRALSNGDVMYLEYSTNGINWNVLDTYTSNQGPWILLEYDLTEFLGNEYFSIRFHFVSNESGTSIGCYFDDLRIDNMTSVGENQDEMDIKLFPNPVNSILNVELPTNQEVEVKMMNNLGEVVYSVKAEKSCKINVSEFAAGIYYIHYQGDNYQGVKKVVIR